MISAENIPIKKKVALDLYTLKRRLETAAHQLTYLFWECTTRCALSCLHCGSDCSVDSSMPDMPLADFLGVLDSITKHYDPSKIVVCLTGGEPLLRNDLEEAGLEISRRGFPWGMVTSGYGISTKRFSSLLDSGIKSIAVSFDGLCDDHNWLRGNTQSFKHSITCIDLATKTDQQRVFFDVVTCVNTRNFKDLHAIKRLLVDKGVMHWRLVTIFPKGRAAGNEELLLDRYSFQGLMNFIKETREEGLIHVSYGCEGFLGGYELEVRDVPFFCVAGIRIGSVLVDGSISACPSLRYDYIQGSIYADDFVEVWEKRFKNMRNRTWAKTGECRSCKRWKYCQGNGLHLRDQKSGDLLFCHYLKLTDAE